MNCYMVQLQWWHQGLAVHTIFRECQLTSGTAEYFVGGLCSKNLVQYKVPSVSKGEVVFMQEWKQKNYSL